MSSHGAIFSPVQLGSGRYTVAVKDCIDIAGLPTKGGSAALADAPPADRNAAVVESLLQGDCHIVGKANMHELAFGVTGLNAWTGSPVNPAFPDRLPGGSSSGSAVAVAEGLVDFSVGTDTGGSIRTPAACCGIFGLKPSFGRISREGAWPRESTLDCIGPMARSMAMIERAMEIMAPGYRPSDAPELRYAVVRVADVDQPVQSAFDAAVGRLPSPASVVQLDGLQAAYAANMAIIGAETYAAFGHLLPTGLLGADVAARLAAAAQVDQVALRRAEAVRAEFGAEVDALLAGCDVLVLPTLPCFPLSLAEVGAGVPPLRMSALVRPFNLTGHPALTVPVTAAEGLPVGIQIVGRRGEDETVCAFGRQLEAAIAMNKSPAEEEAS